MCDGIWLGRVLFYEYVRLSRSVIQFLRVEYTIERFSSIRFAEEPQCKYIWLFYPIYNMAVDIISNIAVE